MKSRADTDGPIQLVVDSTGLKIFGEGEWLQNKHKTTAICSDLTTADVGDPTALPELLDQIDGEVTRFIGDGAYDGNPTSDLLVKLFGVDVEITIPQLRVIQRCATSALLP